MFGCLLCVIFDDLEIVLFMGVNNSYIFVLVIVFVSGVVVVVGMMLVMKINFDLMIGLLWFLFVFEVVIIGGMGNIWGIFVGGIILGVV